MKDLGARSASSPVPSAPVSGVLCQALSPPRHSLSLPLALARFSFCALVCVLHQAKANQKAREHEDSLPTPRIRALDRYVSDVQESETGIETSARRRRRKKRWWYTSGSFIPKLEPGSPMPGFLEFTAAKTSSKMPGRVFFADHFEQVTGDGRATTVP